MVSSRPPNLPIADDGRRARAGRAGSRGTPPCWAAASLERDAATRPRARPPRARSSRARTAPRRSRRAACASDPELLRLLEPAQASRRSAAARRGASTGASARRKSARALARREGRPGSARPLSSSGWAISISVTSSPRAQRLAPGSTSSSGRAASSSRYAVRGPAADTKRSNWLERLVGIGRSARARRAAREERGPARAAPRPGTGSAGGPPGPARQVLAGAVRVAEAGRLERGVARDAQRAGRGGGRRGEELAEGPVHAARSRAGARP